MILKNRQHKIYDWDNPTNGVLPTISKHQYFVISNSVTLPLKHIFNILEPLISSKDFLKPELLTLKSLHRTTQRIHSYMQQLNDISIEADTLEAFTCNQYQAIAHSLNNPLTVMLGQIEKALRKENFSNEDRNELHKIKVHTEQIILFLGEIKKAHQDLLKIQK